MPDRKKVVKWFEFCRVEDKCSTDCPYWDNDSSARKCTNELAKDVLTLLKEQEDEKKRIMKVIWDTLHEVLSIDTVADQDWVYERIRHQIEDT